MHPDLQKYLDGELPRTVLPPEAVAELAAWERIDGTVAELRGAAAPAWLEPAVMANVLNRPERVSWPRRAWRWLLTPRPLQVRPLVPVAAAAALVLSIVLRNDAPAPPQGGAAVVAPVPVVYVQFALNAAGARTVAVAGDFNDWSVEAGALREVDGTGVWRGLIAVRPGVHKYMFVINGEEWVTDPAAERHVDDGFGMRNALLAVVPPGSAL
jgi:hypothetical protein